MKHVLALPFTLNRKDQVVGTVPRPANRPREVISTTERVHGLLLLDSEHLLIQWRVSRATQRVGQEIRTDREMEPVREVTIPLAALAGAKVETRLWRRYLVLTGADLRAFEEVAGNAGIGLPHPAELLVKVRHRDTGAAREFAGELELALADRALRAAEAAPRLPQ